MHSARRKENARTYEKALQKTNIMLIKTIINTYIILFTDAVSNVLRLKRGRIL